VLNYKNLYFGEETMRIGFFDSGVGGLTVLAEALRQLPNEDYIYFADRVHAPYGTRSKTEVRKYVLEAVSFMAGKGLKALVVACNTATSITIDDLRAQYSFPILGMEPAVKLALERTDSKRILVLATPLTLKEKRYKDLVMRLDHFHLVDALALPGLVEFAENFVFEKEVIHNYLKHEFKDLDLHNYSTVVLGCTHFPYYKNYLQEIFPPSVEFIDGSVGTIKQLKKILNLKDSAEKGLGDVVFYTSGVKEPQNTEYEKYLRILQK
jgi:glutamate racemase